MTLKHETERMGQPGRKTEPGHIALAEARLAERGEALGATWLQVATAQRIAADKIREGYPGEYGFRRGELYLEFVCLPTNVVPFRRREEA